MKKLVIGYWLLVIGVLPCGAAERFDSFKRSDLIPTTGDVAQVSASLTAASNALAGATATVAGDLADFESVQAGTNTALQADIDTRQPAATAATDAELEAHTGNSSNPHSVTKAQVSLGNVDNTADADKPISTAQASTNAAFQTAIGGKVGTNDFQVLETEVSGKVSLDGSNITTNYTLPTNITVSGWTDPELNTNYVYVAQYDDWEYEGTVWAGIYWAADHWEFWVDESAVDTNTTTGATVLPKTGWSVITVDYSGDTQLWVEKIGGAKKTEVSALSDSVGVLQQTVITNSYTNGTTGIIVGNMLSIGQLNIGGSSATIAAQSSIGGSSVQAGLGVVTISSRDELNDLSVINLDGNVDVGGSMTLDETITSWGDIAPVQGVPLNAPITITNDSSWTGWTTTGSLSGTNIVLAVGQYLLSPAQTNGIAEWTLSATNSDKYAVIQSVVTNGVSTGENVWYGSTGQLMITNSGSLPYPGAPPSYSISQITITGFEDTSEAATAKYVSALCGIEQETKDCQLTRKVYVDAGDEASVASAAASLAAYAANADKTVVCARLRIGEDYELVGDGGVAGTIWAVNGCQITGGGELVATEYGLGIQRNGRQLLSFRDYASGVYITNFNATTWTVDVATNGVTSTPFLEWSPSLTVQDWQTLPDTPTLTGAVYRFVVADPPTNSTVFVRAMQPEGTSAVLIDAQVLSLKDSTGGVWAITISTNGVLTTTKE